MDVEAVRNVAHRYVYQIERLSTPCEVCYIVRFLHKDLFAIILCTGVVPATYVCIIVQELSPCVASERFVSEYCTEFSRSSLDVVK